MRILLVGPNHPGGSIPPYLDVLQAGLAAAGAHVERVGSDGPPYDPERGGFRPTSEIVAAARALLSQVDLGAFDVVSLHFGNLEVEQLLPVLWSGARRPPVVYHVHSLAWTLFDRHCPDPRLRAAVAQAAASMDGYVFFGGHAARTLSRPPYVPAATCFLPTTIPPCTPASPRPRGDLPRLASLYGYPAPWKDAARLVDALARLRHPVRFHLAGPFWDDPAQVGAVLPVGVSRHGVAELTVTPAYLDAPARASLVARTSVAVFPYRPAATFQGSGAIADYLAHGVPVVAADVANMAELVADAGVIVPPGDPAALAAALDRFLGDAGHRQRLADAAAARAGLFRRDTHTAACLDLYERVLTRRKVVA
ncbi:glycosyltransferase [Sphaerimonospora cavernae]|uniref:Glycosyltransferase n=1 Tax=Sphaerimonospora cavernae TaxID=1740611 RepID=A0ABV6U1V4_9ACTN